MSFGISLVKKPIIGCIIGCSINPFALQNSQSHSQMVSRSSSICNSFQIHEEEIFFQSFNCHPFQSLQFLMARTHRLKPPGNWYLPGQETNHRVHHRLQHKPLCLTKFPVPFPDGLEKTILLSSFLVLLDS